MITSLFNSSHQTSLMIQWLRIFLVMQATRVHSLDRGKKDSTCHVMQPKNNFFFLSINSNLAYKGFPRLGCNPSLCCQFALSPLTRTFGQHASVSSSSPDSFSGCGHLSSKDKYPTFCLSFCSALDQMSAPLRSLIVSPTPPCNP